MLSFAKPNYEYLQQKMGVGDAEELRTKMISLTEKLDFTELAADVEPFLFNPSDSKKVDLFPEFIRQVKL